MTASIEQADFLSSIMGKDIGTGYILMIMPTQNDMRMLIHFMAERQGINWLNRSMNAA